MILFELLIQFALAFTFAASSQSQLNVLIGIDFIKEALDTSSPSIYDKIKLSVKDTKPFDQNVGPENYQLSDFSLTDFEYHPNDLSIIVPSKENLLSIELSKDKVYIYLDTELTINGKIADKFILLKRGKPRDFWVKLKVKALVDILVSPSPQSLQVSVQLLKIKHKILEAKVEGHLVLTTLIRSSNLVDKIIDKIISKKVPGIINKAISKAVDPKNEDGFNIKQLVSHVLKIGTNGLSYPESKQEISAKVLLSFSEKKPNVSEIYTTANQDMEVKTETEPESLSFLEDLSEISEPEFINSLVSSIFTPSKHVRAEINEEVLNTITDVIYDESLINFQVNNQLINKIGKGKDDLFNLNTKFFEKSLPCLADYPNQNFTVAISALSKPVSKISNDGKQQIISFNLNVNIKYLLDRDPKIVLLNINANIDAGIIILPVENPETTVFINISSIKLSKVVLLQKCGKLTGDDIVTALGPPLRLIPKILNLKVLQNGYTIKPETIKSLSLSNVELTTTDGQLNLEVLAHFIPK